MIGGCQTIAQHWEISFKRPWSGMTSSAWWAVSVSGQRGQAGRVNRYHNSATTSIKLHNTSSSQSRQLRITDTRLEPENKTVFDSIHTIKESIKRKLNKTEISSGIRGGGSLWRLVTVRCTSNWVDHWCYWRMCSSNITRVRCHCRRTSERGITTSHSCPRHRLGWHYHNANVHHYADSKNDNITVISWVNLNAAVHLFHQPFQSESLAVNGTHWVHFLWADWLTASKLAMNEA